MTSEEIRLLNLTPEDIRLLKRSPEEILEEIARSERHDPWEVIPLDSKRCSVCGKVQKVDAFGFGSASIGDRRQTVCTQCLAEQDAKKQELIKSSHADVCDVLKTHASILADDPERLSTTFLKSLIGSSSEGCQ